MIRNLSDFLHADRWSGTDALFRWFKHPLAILGVLSAVSVLCGFLLNPALLLAAAVLGVVAGIGGVWPWLTLRGIRCRVEVLDSRCGVGEAARIRLTITNRNFWPAWGLTLEGFGDESAAALGRVPARSTVSFDWQFEPKQRGSYPRSLPKLATAFPFGLRQATIPASISGELVVWPRLVTIDDHPTSAVSYSIDGPLSDRKPGNMGDALGTREFQRGDSLRQLHWAQTARLGELIVTERQMASSSGVSLWIDLRMQSHARVGGDGESQSLESMISLGGSIIRLLFESQRPLTVRMGNGELHIPPGGRTAYRHVMDRLAVTPHNGVSDACRVSRHNDLLLVTDRSNASATSARKIIVATDWEAPACAQTGWLSLPATVTLEEFPRLWREACCAA